MDEGNLPSSRRGLSDRPLSDKQLHALTRAAQGASHKVLARELHVDVKTVGGIFQEIFRKLGGAENTAHAVYLACQRGLLPMQPPGTKPGEVRIGPSLRLLRSLMAEGFSVSFIAARMGMGQSELSLLMTRMWLTTAMEARVRRVFVELAGRDPLALGVHQRGCTRARNRGRVEGWEIVPAAEVQQMRTLVPHAA